MEKKFKRILSCLFGGRRKVQVTILPSRSSSQVVRSAANGTTLELTAFGGPEAKPSRASAFWYFSVHNHGFCGSPNTFS